MTTRIPSWAYYGVMVQLTLRLPDDVHARLTAQAKADRRSLNSEILHLLEVALTAVGGDDESP
jgi:predicted HicB family RNase H-like nuclease